MSFCPTKDIHSVYLDNELPEIHKAEYEKHLSECPKCRAELAELQAVREIFQNDVKSITPDEKFLEDSYSRLMIKMSYNKNSCKANKKNPFVRFSYIISTAAAAILLALFVPIGLNSRKPAVTQDFAGIENMIPVRNFADNISFGSGKNVVISGNMENMLSSWVANRGEESFIEDVCNMAYLRPDFAEDNIISIRITIPKVSEIPVNTDFDTFDIELLGNYKWNHLAN